MGGGKAGHLGIASDTDGSESGLIERTSEVSDVGPTVAEWGILFPPGQVKQLDLDAGMREREGTHDL